VVGGPRFVVATYDRSLLPVNVPRSISLSAPSRFGFPDPLSITSVSTHSQRSGSSLLLAIR